MLEVPKGYDPLTTMLRNSLKIRFGHNANLYAASIAVVLAMSAVFAMYRLHRR